MKKLISFSIRSLTLLTCLAILSMLSACEEDKVIEHGYDDIQLIAGRVAGTWSNPTNIVTPVTVPSAVFGDMRILFTTDENGYPANFIASGAPIVFSSIPGTWTVNQTSDKISITLSEITPVDDFNIEVNSSNLVISFYMGWENTETGEKGEGEFSATLSRQ